MAQYEIQHECGHTEYHQISGPNTHGQRETKARQLGEQPCTTCVAATRKRVSKRAAEVAAAEHWPTLTGSPRQVEWAQTIRVDAMTEIAAGGARNAAPAEAASWTPQQVADLDTLLTRIWQRAVLRQTAAKWWIDNQSRILHAAAALLTDNDRAEYKAGVAEIVAGLSPEAAARTARRPEDRDADEVETPYTQLDMPTAEFRERLVDALRDAGERAEAANLARRAAIAEIGELLRRDRAAGGLVGINYAQMITGLSRPTLNDARSDETAWQALVEIASRSDDEAAALHQRLPHLAGWHSAAGHLLRQHIEAYWAERGFDPWSTEDPGEPTGYAELMRVYQQTVDGYAAGEPAYLYELHQREARAGHE
ncbi:MULTISPECIES: hypothetical protein [Asanoa]|uniref:Uncharacterized protein n=2 Tax=Asanoa TaxID=195964 RepID=A0A239PH48_9ACTN|nr:MULTISPECIES: hypothetical protein [Asanoa]GIF75686.1 hypothetical protein Asi02nite_52040 [Asanoa siamensis]SNT66280.1 hypothetical protein SAMN05421812_13627 [Asanoa hainanensis]